MGTIHHHGLRDAQHVGDIAEIDHQIVVTVDIAAFGEPYFRSPRIARLLIGVLHVQPRKELRLLIFTVLPVLAAAVSRSVCRQRKAGIWITSTTSPTGAACHASWMSVSRRSSPLRPHVGEHTQPLFESGAAERGDRGAVGLVERGLEDNIRPEGLVDRHEAFGHGVEQLGGFDDAGAGDEFHSCHFINSGWCDKNSSARARSWGVSMPMVSTSVMPTPIL